MSGQFIQSLRSPLAQSSPPSGFSNMTYSNPTAAPLMNAAMQMVVDQNPGFLGKIQSSQNNVPSYIGQPQMSQQPSRQYGLLGNVTANRLAPAERKKLPIEE